jgi:hypothetical protein
VAGFRPFRRKVLRALTGAKRTFTGAGANVGYRPTAAYQGLGMVTPIPKEFEDSLRKNPAISTLLDGWTRMNLPDCWLVAGAVVQSYWNAAHEYPPLHGVSDIDIVYFEPDDLTAESEFQQSVRIAGEFECLPIQLDIKNEARVHLWYEERFGYAIDAYRSAEAAIDTFPTTAGSIGIRAAGEAIECYTSFGFEDLLELVVRPNKRQITRSIYVKKTARWKTIWPMLKIIDWEDA